LFLSVDLETAKNRVVQRHIYSWGISFEEAIKRWNENDLANALSVLKELKPQLSNQKSGITIFNSSSDLM